MAKLSTFTRIQLALSALGLFMIGAGALPRLGLNAQGASPGQPGVIAAYGFEEGTGTVTADSTGNGNTGTLASATWTTSGRFGKALTFNGTSSRVNIPDAGTLDLTIGMTLEAWVRPTALTGWHAVLMKETASGLAYALYAHDGAKPAVYINTGSADIGQSAAATLALSTWTHLATTYDGATLRVYVNGTQVSSRTAAGALITSSNALRIGGNAIWGEYFTGSIDEVRVYGRALSATEIQTDMNAPILQSDTTPPTVSLVSPAGGATGVPAASNVSATFSEAMNATTITGSTFEVRNAANQVVSAAVTYNAATFVATLDPTIDLPGGSYTATIRGGTTDPRAMDAAGNALASNVVWTFTVAASDTTPPTVTSTLPASGATAVAAAANVTATFSEAMTAASIDGTAVELRTAANVLVPASVTYNAATFTVTLDPAADLASGATYTAVIKGGVADPRVKDAAGNALAANVSWTFTVADTAPPSVTAATPAAGATNVPVAANVSATFSETMTAASIDGTTVELRTAANVLVPATVTYNAVTFTVTLDPAGDLASGAAYTALVKGGAADPRVKDAAGNALGANVSWTFTTVPPVDTTPPSVTTMTPPAGATNVPIASNVTATFSEAMTASSLDSSAVELRTAGDAVVPAAVSYNAATLTVTLDPAADLAPNAIYTAIIKGGTVDPRVKDAAGNALAANVSWTFTTGACPCTIWPASTTPGAQDGGDTSAVQVGVKFQTDVAGLVTGVRFYKGAANTGTHVGNLWTAAGALLGSVTFADETTSGWQEAAFATPITVAPNTVYVVSYFAPSGHYAFDAAYFASAVNSGPLHALSSTTSPNGVFAYGSSPTVFPNSSFNAANYWVDVVFQGQLDTTPPVVSAFQPGSGATGVTTAASVAATFNEPLTPGSVSTSTFELRGPGNVLVASIVSYDAATRTATLTPSAALAAGAGYTATLIGGATDPRIKDAAGNALASNVSWSFTTAVPPPSMTITTPANGATGVALATTVTATFDQDLDPTTVTTATFEVRTPANALVPATVSYHAGSRTATLVPSSPLSSSTVYTATLRGGPTDPRIKNASGVALAGSVVWSFTTLTPAVNCPCSIWPASAVPATASFSDASAVEVGVKFQPDRNGYVTGIRFYKGSANTGIHVGSLWSAAGALLGSVTFANETASGWQQAIFSQPLAVTANTTYMASYYAPVGRYAVDNGYFAAVVDNPPLRALANATSPNGMFGYSAAATTFPTQSGNGANYWVDVVFTDVLDTTPPTVNSTTPANGTSGVPLATSITAAFSEDLNPSTVSGTTFELRSSDNTLVSGTVSYDAASRTAGLVPSAALAASTIYSATLRGGPSGVKDWGGNALASDVAWSFTTSLPPPAVTATAPASGATSVSLATAVTATFDRDLDPATVTAATFELRLPNSTVVPAVVSYNAGTRTATLVPSAPLSGSTVYSAALRGGSTDPRVKSAAGIALEANVGWSFTTTVPTVNCPCSIWNSLTVPATPSSGDASAVEVGLKFQPDRSGFITAIRFYKGGTNTGTHVGSLWTAGGALLGSVTFNGESGSGWQQATFGSPIAVTANTVYVASYYAPVGRYAADTGFFSAAIDNPPLRALATGTSPNGIYVYTTTPSVFPNQSGNGANYWVDVVFQTSVGPDTTPPAIVAQSPSSGATGVSVWAPATAAFNEPLDPATVSSTTVELRTPASALVPATVSYNAVSRTATLQPWTALAPSTTYTVTVRGGATDPRIRDAAGNPLASNAGWSFTTMAAPAAPPNDGPGGPILVISSSLNPFTRYYGEILRNEGLNAFTVSDISLVTATVLNNYDTIILGEMALTSAQSSMLTSWVTGGGNLVAMRPDKQLAGLLGLTDGNAILSNRYLQIDPAGPGAGLVNQTIQYHGTADRYTLSTATAVAMLHSDATTATNSPAVSLRSVGASGGQAAAFTYDLARSIVYTRQGNPAWAGQNRDGQGAVRSDDMFFGPAAMDPQPDWIDFNKVAIPQADEQQRLLANLLLLMSNDRKPVPRFWYLPRGLKAAVVMTGDDHSSGGTAGRFDIEKAASPTGCSVANWECVRSTSYIYTDTPITNAQAAAYTADGFEVALHTSTNCADYSASGLGGVYTSQLAPWLAKYTSVPAPATNRMHCIVWSDYSTQPLVELTNGIRLDTTYYYWPAEWVLDRPGLFTGSGMPMRFAQMDGTTIDVYQATTQLTDESGQTYPLHVDTLLDRALGPEGYYGVFTANMHTDQAVHAGSEAIIASAQARGVPVVSARQMLTWLDGRNGSSFGSVAWSLGTLSFTVAQASGAAGLQAMLPATAVTGPIISLKRSGVAVPYTLQTIKGLTYAVFNVQSGSYAAVYMSVPETTISSAPAATTNSTSASFSFSATPLGVTNTFECSLDGVAFAACTSPRNYTSLTGGGHTFQVRSVNTAGTDPTPASFTWTVTPPDTTITASPASASTSTSASFSFTAAPTGATFQCSLDGAAFTTCTTPTTYTGLASTSHTFQVRAVTSAGVDPTPAGFNWTITTLIAAYGFEEGSGTATADSSTFANNGTLSNATWAATGKFGKALTFNGTNAWVTVPHASSLSLTTAITMEAWVNPTANGANWRTILMKEATGSLSYNFYAHNGKTGPGGYVRVGSSDYGAEAAAAVALNTWTHLAATYDGSTVRLYVNGVQVATKAISGSIVTSTGVLRIGGNSVWGEYFAGMIDEVRIYSRVLTAAEIMTDMNTPVKP